MSILTDLLEKKITFQQAAQKAEGWASNLVSHDPVLANAAGTILSDVKQAASNAVDMADKGIVAWATPAAKATELALETALAGATGGASLPFNTFITDGIDQLVNVVKAEADAFALKAKASLAPANPAAAVHQG